MPTLNVYFNSIYERNELEKLLEGNVPVVLSVIPRAFIDGKVIKQYPVWFIDIIRDAASSPNVLISQRGYGHKCRNPHKKVDPWHENTCPYNFSLDGGLERQRELMLRGRDVVERFVGRSPDCYAPPNHIFDNVTLALAVELGYKFFMDKAMIGCMFLYSRGRLRIVPESPCGIQNSEHFYFYYDHIEGSHSPKFSARDRNNYECLLDNVQPLDSYEHSNISQSKIMANSAIRVLSKYVRDIRNLIKN